MDNREELATAVPIENTGADASEATPQEALAMSTLQVVPPKGYVVVAKYLFASKAAANGFARRLFSVRSGATIDSRVEVHPFNG